MIIEDIRGARWAEFVAGCAASHPFHHPAWATLLSDCYGYRGTALALKNESGRITAGLPILETRSPLGGRRWVSLPFTDYCPPLVVRREDERRLVAGLIISAREAGIGQIQIRGNLADPESHVASVGVMHTLRLSPDPEEVFATFKKTQIRQCIGQAQRAGVVVERGTSREHLIDSFYSLHLRTRHRLGVPVQPRRFFELLWERIVEPDLGFVLVARIGETPIAAGVFLAWNGTVTYKYSASDSGSWKLRPNHLLLWSAIRSACENGFGTFDFGRTDPENQGLRDFKRGWGTQEEPLLYSFLGDRPHKASNGRLNRAAGLVIRRSPPFVCRAVGELLYKYAD